MKGESKKEVKDNASRSDSDELNRQAQMNAVWQRIEKKARSQGRKKKLDREKLAFRVILPIFIIESIVLVALVVMVGLGFVGFSGKAPSAKTVSVYNVCGQDIVDEYNSLITIEDSDEYSNKLIELGDKVAKRSNANDDATCQYVIMQSSLQQHDGEKAKNAVDRLNHLASQGVYPNNNIYGLMTSSEIDSMASYIDEMEQNNWVSGGVG